MSPRVPSQPCPGLGAMLRNGSRLVPLFGVMLKLHMEGTAAGIWGWRWDSSGDILDFFSILAVLQDCYPFGQEVALELAAEPGTAYSSHGDRQGESRSVTGWRWKADGLPWSFQTGCVSSDTHSRTPLTWRALMQCLGSGKHAPGAGSISLAQAVPWERG